MKRQARQLLADASEGAQGTTVQLVLALEAALQLERHLAHLGEDPVTKSLDLFCQGARVLGGLTAISW